MANGFDIEKQYVEKYQIIQKKLYQDQHYEIDGMKNMKYIRMKRVTSKQASTKIYQLFF